MRGEYYLDQASGAVLHPWLEMCAELLQIVSQKFIATLKHTFHECKCIFGSDRSSRSGNFRLPPDHKFTRALNFNLSDSKL